MGHPSRYAFFSSRYAPEVGGVESFTKNIAHELVQSGDEVTIISLNVSGARAHEIQDDGVEVLRLPCHPLMNGRLPWANKNTEYRALLKEASKRDFDRVLVNTRFYGHSLDGLRFARSIGAKAVVLDHGSAYLTLGNGAADTAIRLYEHIMTRRDKTFSPTFAGISTMSARWLETFGIKTTLVIPNAIDAAEFRNAASSRDFRKELSVPDGATLVVSVGRLSPEKGSRALTESARLLGDSVKIVLAGEGSLRGELETCLPRNAHLLGNLSHPDLSALLSQADIFCLPSRSEGFCTSLLEAGAWGLVPLMTHVGGTDEVMGNPIRFGRLLPDMREESVAQGIRYMVERGETGLSDELRVHVEKHCSWKASADRFRAAFDD